MAEQMEEHSALCSQLDECVGDESGLDAFLTRLANFIEQHAEDLMARRGITEGPLPDDVEDMDVLLNCCRATAALQPDSTSDPALKCKVCNSVCPPFALTDYFPSRIFLIYRQLGMQNLAMSVHGGSHLQSIFVKAKIKMNRSKSIKHCHMPMRREEVSPSL